MGSLVINSTTDRIARTTSLPALSGCTVAGWVKPSDVSPASNQYAVHVPADTDAGLIFYNGELYVLGGSGTTVFGSSPSAGSWLYVALTSNGTDTIGYWWTDSSGTPVLGDSETRADAGTGTTIGMSIGNRSTPDQGLVGKFAYWKAWSAVLSQSALEAEMYAPDFLPANSASKLCGFADSQTDLAGASDWTLTSIDTDSDTPPVDFGGAFKSAWSMNSNGIITRG